MITKTFAFYLSVLRRQFTSYCSEKLAGMDVTYGQLYIIIFVGKQESCSPKDISLALHLDAGHLNRTLAKLIQSGLIQQKKNERDRRANIVTLTGKGRDVFEKSRRLFDEWDKEILEPLTESEKETLLGLLKKITVYEATDAAR